jgi:hypothetical protein
MMMVVLGISCNVNVEFSKLKDGKLTSFDQKCRPKKTKLSISTICKC